MSSQKINSAEIKALIKKCLSDELNQPIDQINEDASFTELGVDSVTALTLLGELEDACQRQLEIDELEQANSINALTDYLVQK
jgi:acyl carrier protein